MKVFIVGGTGFIGRNIAGKLLEENHEVVVLSRSAQKANKLFQGKVAVVEGDPNKQGKWQDEVTKCDATVVLCGEPIIDKKWSAERKRLLLDSRLIPTKLTIQAMRNEKSKNKILLCGSAIGFYGNRGSEKLTEESAPGEGFATELCEAWEEEANKAKAYGIRVVNLRTSFVLAKNGGGLAKMVKPFKFFMGGPTGSGKQFVSWIHIQDYESLCVYSLGNSDIEGPLNMSAPNPVLNRDLAKSIGRAIKKPSRLKVPAFILKIMLGEAARLLLDSQRVIPKKASRSGFKFRFDNIQSALNDVLR